MNFDCLFRRLVESAMVEAIRRYFPNWVTTLYIRLIEIGKFSNLSCWSKATKINSKIEGLLELICYEALLEGFESVYLQINVALWRLNIEWSYYIVGYVQ